MRWVKRKRVGHRSKETCGAPEKIESEKKKFEKMIKAEEQKKTKEKKMMEATEGDVQSCERSSYD